MRRINAIMPVVFLGISLAFFSCQKRPERVELTDWQFSWHNQWYPATVPGFIHTDLMANGIIPDPYYGTNEDSVQWVYDERQWVYHTVVDRKALPSGDTVWFVFEGLAGPCEVEIRGRWKDTNDTSFVMWCQHFSDDMFIENAIDFEPIGDSFDITVRFLNGFPDKVYKLFRFTGTLETHDKLDHGDHTPFSSY